MGQELLILIVLIAVAIFAIAALRSRPKRNGKGEGGGQWQASRPRRNGGRQWQTSVKGNLAMVVDGTRITIFAQDGGWKYVISDNGDGDNEDGTYFSEKYETAEAAKYEALVDLDGGTSRHRTVAEKRSERRLDAWEKAIRDREQLIADISDLLMREDLNVTALRKPEKRIASQLKALVPPLIVSL